MIIVVLLLIFPLKSFASNNGNESFIAMNPIVRFDDPKNNDNSTELGVCYGSNTQWSSYPYIVALRFSTGCTGTIIDMGSASPNRPAVGATWSTNLATKLTHAMRFELMPTNR